MKDNYKEIVNFDYATRCYVGEESYNILREYTNNPYFLDPEYTPEIYREARVNIARLIGSSPEEIALISDTSLSINVIAQSLPLSIRNKIILSNTEPPENLYPWLKLEEKGFQLKILKSNKELDLDEILKNVDDKVLLMSLTHINPLTGVRNPANIIARYLKEFDVMMLLDASYSLGILDTKPNKYKIEFLVSDGDKWLCSPPCSGIAYINRKILDRLRSPLPSKYGDINPLENNFRQFIPNKTAVKMEPSEPNPLSYLILSRSIEKILDVGIENIERKILTFGGWLIDELEKIGFKVITPYDREKRGGIISFYTGEKGNLLKGFLMEKGLKTSVIGNIMRISLHYMHVEEDIYLLIDMLKEGVEKLNLFSRRSF